MSDIKDFKIRSVEVSEAAIAIRSIAYRGESFAGGTGGGGGAISEALSASKAASEAKSMALLGGGGGGDSTEATSEATSKAQSEIETVHSIAIRGESYALVGDSLSDRAESLARTAGGGGSVDMAPFFAIDSTGDQSLTATVVTIIIDSVVTSHAYYSLSGNEVTIQSGGAGTYKIDYSVIYDITSTAGGTRGACTTWLEKNESVINGSHGRAYHREASGGSGLGGFATIPLIVGDIIRVRAQATYSNTAIDTVQNMSSISFLKVG